MAKLHCRLAGFNSHDASQIADLAGLVHTHLSDDWSFGAAGTGPCDLLLCDVESVPGAAAWQEGGQHGVPRAAAASEVPAGGGLALLKPLRIHGPGGLVHILNEAAQLGAALADPAQPSPGSAEAGPATRADGMAPAGKRGGLRSLLRTLPGWLSGPLTRTAVQLPAPAPAGGIRASTAAFQPSANEAGGWDAGPSPDGAAGAAELTGPSHMDHATAGSGLPASAPCQGTATHGTEGLDLLELLRRAKMASQVIVIRMDGIPAICAAPATGMAYTFAKLQAVHDCPHAVFWTNRVTVAQNSYYGRTEVLPDPDGPPVSVPALPLKNLLWVAILRCGGPDQAAPFQDGAFKLRAWPDLAGLPHARHHVAWCGLLARRAMTAAALAEKTSHNAEEAAVFMAACHELGVLQQEALPASAPGRIGQAPAGQEAGQSPARRTLERISVLRGILHRLGLQHP